MSPEFCEKICNIKVTYRSLENVAKFMCLGTTVINPNLIHVEIKSRQKSSSCYSLFYDILSSCQLSKNVKIKIYRILPVVTCECGTLSVTLRDKHRLMVLEKRALRRIFGPKRDEVIG
jgi:hypothetical protein